MLIGAFWNVLRTIYARLQVLPFSADLPAPELRRRYESLSFFLECGAPSLPHVEERTIAASSGHRRVRVYNPSAIPLRSVPRRALRGAVRSHGGYE